MARPGKTGLDYSEWDVTVLSGDTDIDRILEAQGCAGFVVYFYLCQMAYSIKGYYYEWTYDDAATTAKRIGGGVRSDTVIQTVKLCFRLGLFDKGLFDRYGILTSRRIQRGYMKVAERRVGCIIEEAYSLLQKNSEGGCDKHTLERNNRDRNARFCNRNPGFDSRNDTNSRVEQSTGEKSRETRAPAGAEGDAPLSSPGQKDAEPEFENPFSGALGEAFADWLAYKQERRQPYKPVGLKNLITQLVNSAARCGEDAVVEAIRSSMACNYQGIVFPKGQDGKRQPSGGARTGGGSFMDMYMEEMRK